MFTLRVLDFLPWEALESLRRSSREVAGGGVGGGRWFASQIGERASQSAARLESDVRCVERHRVPHVNGGKRVYLPTC